MTETRSSGGSVARSLTRGLLGTMKRRKWAWAMTGVMIASGMAYSIWWTAVVRHSRLAYWVIPSDIWLTIRDAHYIVWGALPYLYGSGTGLVTLPGLPLVLSPFVALGDRLHLTESFGPWIVARPSGWLLYGPLVIAMGASVIFAADAWTEELGLSQVRRVFCDVAFMVATWDMVVRWGHPEDALALTAVLYCLLSVRQTRWLRAGWCLGVAFCFQPLVVLILPIVAVAAGRRHVGPLLLRAALLPGGLLGVVLAIDARDVITSVIKEPNYPLIDQPTPWARLSPALGHHSIGAGPSRVVALAVAFALGGLAWRWRDNWARLLWLGACMLATRGVFEAVMVPYYVTPALLLALLVAVVSLPWWRVLLVGASSGLVVYQFDSRSASLWTWWLESAGILVLTILLAAPFIRAPAETRIDETRGAVSWDQLETEPALSTSGAPHVAETVTATS